MFQHGHQNHKFTVYLSKVSLMDRNYAYPVAKLQKWSHLFNKIIEIIRKITEIVSTY